MSNKYLNSTEYQGVICYDGKKTGVNAKKEEAGPPTANYKSTCISKYAANSYRLKRKSEIKLRGLAGRRLSRHRKAGTANSVAVITFGAPIRLIRNNTS
jgi:hypothetical protein